MEGQQRNNMESRDQNNMESNDRNNASEIPPMEKDRSSDIASYVNIVNGIALPYEPYMYFHKNILKDHLSNNAIPSRIAFLRQIKAELLVELDNILDFQPRVQDLMDRSRQFKKS